jgi:hypothetical protein
MYQSIKYNVVYQVMKLHILICLLIVLLDSYSCTKLTESQEYLTNIKVVRRGLYIGSDNLVLPKYKFIAHSGLLVTTDKNNIYLMEYMADNTVHVTLSKNIQIIKQHKAYDSVFITTGSKTDKWTVQKTGCTPIKLTLNDAVNIMKYSKYSIFENKTCHSAQQKLRDLVCI